MIELPHQHHTENDIRHIAESLPNAETANAVATAMKQLGDPTRLRIFWILCHTEACVVNLAAMMQMSSPAVAHHLRILKDAGLLRSRRSGKEVYYRASDAPLAGTLHRVIESLASITCPQTGDSVGE